MLWLRGVIVTGGPGVVGAYVPFLYYRGSELKDGFWRIGWVLVGVGAAMYLLCLLAFLASAGRRDFFHASAEIYLGEEPPSWCPEACIASRAYPMYVGVVTAVFGQGR